MSTLDPSTGYTCVACQLVFNSSELQKEHYKTEWHRYNLKRQAVELPPISAEQFEMKLKTMKNEKEELAKSADQTFYCSICRKQLKSLNAYNDHIISKRHKEMETKEKKGPKQARKKASNIRTSTSSDAPTNEVEMKDEESDEDDDSSSGWVTDHGSEDEDEAMELDDSQALPVTSCLFCSTSKASLAQSLEHMQYAHGFQLPDKQYISDEEGLVKYLGLKVGAGRCCIFCPDSRSRFASLSACQKHMKDKEHCKLRRDPESMIELADFYDYSSMYADENEASADVLYDDGWTLTLPSGARIGHRSLLRYYKQYLRPVAAGDESRDAGRAAIDKAKGFYKALSWTGATGTEAKNVARDIRYIERYKRRFDVRVACKSGKLFKTQGRVGDN